MKKYLCMHYEKLNQVLSIALLSVGLSGCAQLSDSLQIVNDTLAKANSGLGALSGSSSDKFSLPDKITSQYEVRNLSVSFVTVGRDTSAVFTGQAYNRTSKRIRVMVFIPTYDPQGYHSGDVQAEFTIPAKEKIRIDVTANYALDPSKGEKMNTSKTRYRVDTF